MKDCRDNLVYFTELKPEKKIAEKLQLTQVVDKLEADYEVSDNSSMNIYSFSFNIFFTT